jgi:ribose transport system ATP-binding protein
VAIVYQELSLFPDLSIVSNLFSGGEPGRRGVVDREAMLRAARPVLARLGITTDPHELVRRLRVGERQLIEIARALLEHPRVLILDEPNSALNSNETERLFDIVRTLRSEGISIVLVSHRLAEVFDISDRITVMRNGRVVLRRTRAELTMEDVVTAMIGRSQTASFPPRLPATGAGRGGALRVEGLSAGDSLQDVSFQVEPGQVVGVAGLEGSGASTLLATLFGLQAATGGSATFPDGGPVPSSPREAAQRRVCLVPADRRRDGLMLMQPIALNAGHVSVGAMPGPWRAGPDRFRDLATRQIALLGIKARSPWSLVHELSGGNQQKVVVAKWLEVDPQLILLDDPTRGIDIGAKFEMYSLIRRLAADGHLVLLASSELPELVGLADRVLVFFRGRLAGTLEPPALDEDVLLHAINTGELRAAFPTRQPGAQ